MLIIGSPKEILPIVSNTAFKFVVYNLSSNYVNPSIPQLNLMQLPGLDYTSKDVDQQVYNTIFNNDLYFCELMKIIIPLYQGKDVALMVYREEDFFDPYTETIGKLIQQRYGYNYQLINAFDDWQPFDISSFNINGAFYLDQDIKRYNNIILQTNPNAFIGEKIDDSHF